jgi:hypothetical protein
VLEHRENGDKRDLAESTDGGLFESLGERREFFE